MSLSSSLFFLYPAQFEISEKMKVAQFALSVRVYLNNAAATYWPLNGPCHTSCNTVPCTQQHELRLQFRSSPPGDDVEPCRLGNTGETLQVDIAAPWAWCTVCWCRPLSLQNSNAWGGSNILRVTLLFPHILFVYLKIISLFLKNILFFLFCLVSFTNVQYLLFFVLSR